MLHSDHMEYAEKFAEQNTDICFNEETKQRIEKIYTYYKENLPDLLRIE